MCTEQIAILLEVIGFVLASFFIAILRIDKMKDIADKIKTLIIDFGEESVSMTSIMIRVAFFASLYMLLKGIIELKLPEGTRAWQYPKLIYKETISKYIRFVPVLLLAIPFLISELIMNVLRFVAQKLSGKDIVTTFLIVLGSLMILAGLLMELISTWW